MFGRRKSPDIPRTGSRSAGRRTGGRGISASADKRRAASSWRRTDAKKTGTPRPDVRKAVKNPRLPKKSSAQRPGFRDWERLRLWTVAAAFALLWVCLWGRAYYLQIVMGPEYAAMAKRQQTTRETVQGMRGNILDRNGNIMARSVESQSVCADPLLVKDKQATAVALAEILNLPVGKLYSLLQEKNGLSGWNGKLIIKRRSK